MEQILSNIKEQEPIVIEQQQKKTKFLGKLRPQKGQRVFELNLKTLNVIDVTPKVKDITLSGIESRKLQIKENCIYCVALNESNSERKFIAILNKISAEKGSDIRYHRK